MRLLRLGSSPLPALIFLLVMGACSPPPEAPKDLAELSAYLFREHENEDLRVLSVGMGNLEDLLLQHDLDGDVDGRSFSLPDLDEADVSGVAHPDADLKGCLPVAVAGRSRYAIEWSALFAMESDQRPAEPSAEAYERVFIDPEDPSCYADRSCEWMRTRNYITRSNPLYTIPFELPKNFRWVPIWKDGEETGRNAMVARSWIEESFWAEDEETQMVQSFTLDTWIEQEDGSTLRYQTLWSETIIPGVTDEDLIRYVIVDGIGDAFEAADDAFEEMYSL